MIYNHKLINDLAWCIASPCLINDSDYHDPHLLADDWFQQQISNNQALLLEQDKAPHLIQAYLSKMPTFKLGIYFENLIAYWFSIHPEYEILHQNLVISSETKTIGEFDLILRETSTQKVIHLEVAVKFFLEISFSDRTHWLGPNLIDSLDTKFDKLINKQIKLSSKKEALATLKKNNIEIDEHRIILKGRLFKKNGFNENQYSWINIDSFIEMEGDNSKWIILPKTHWLSEINNLNYNFLANEQYDKKSLNSVLIESLKSLPICIAKTINDIEIKRLFITPNDWEERAINSLT